MKNRPGVLLVQRWLRGDEGIVTHFGLLSRGLLKRGWRVGLVTSPGVHGGEYNQPIDWVEELGVPWYRVPFPPKVVHGGTIKASRALLDVIREFNADILQTSSLSLLISLHVCRAFRGIPIVSTPESSRHGVTSTRARVLGRLWPAFAGDRLVAVSSEMKDLILTSFGVPADRIRVIPHAVKDSYFRSPSNEERAVAQESLGVKETDFVVSLVGRLDLRMKRHDVLIEAIRQLREDGIPAVALIAGVGPGEVAIREIAASKRVSEHVRMLGYSDARKVYWASGVTVLPSHGEAFGIVVAEAMSCGVVPVRTPGPGVKDQIEEGKTGFVVPYNNPTALADKLRYLAQEPNRVKEMSAAALEMAQLRFTAERMVADTVAVYNEVLRA